MVDQIEGVIISWPGKGRDDFFSYCQAGSTTVFEPASRPYVAGYLMAEYIHRKFGGDALKDIHREFLKFPFFGPAAAIKRITGQRARDIFSDVAIEVAARAAKNMLRMTISRIFPPQGGGGGHAARLRPS